ncbi:MAG TPA: hypothetical protein VK097_12625 [Lentibacillus sp.]|nr:hypothetical protein [Lentibacillus sp.]HLR63268.1 hypothetical protein [Lentibacillus sp.]
MAVIVSSIGLKGIEGYRIEVDVQLLPGDATMRRSHGCKQQKGMVQ